MKNNDVRGTLNTTINKEIYSKFRGRCNEIGINIKDMISIFIAEYVNGNFEIGLKQKKNNDKNDN